MKSKLKQAKYCTKQWCGCKLCKPQKGGHVNRRSVRDQHLSEGHEQQVKDIL
jgi:hypothetical protein